MAIVRKSRKSKITDEEPSMSSPQGEVSRAVPEVNADVPRKEASKSKAHANANNEAFEDNSERAGHKKVIVRAKGRRGHTSEAEQSASFHEMNTELSRRLTVISM